MESHRLTRREKARSDWPGVRFRRELLSVALVAPLSLSALVVFGSKEGAVDYLIGVGVAVVLTLFLAPLAEFGWCYFKAPSRLLTDDVIAIRELVVGRDARLAEQQERESQAREVRFREEREEGERNRLAGEEGVRQRREDELRGVVVVIAEDFDTLREAVEEALKWGDQWAGHGGFRTLHPGFRVRGDVRPLADRKGLEDLYNKVVRVYRLQERLNQLGSARSQGEHLPGENHSELLAELRDALDETRPQLDRAGEMAED